MCSGNKVGCKERNLLNEHFSTISHGPLQALRPSRVLILEYILPMTQCHSCHFITPVVFVLATLSSPHASRPVAAQITEMAMNCVGPVAAVSTATQKANEHVQGATKPHQATDAAKSRPQPPSARTSLDEPDLPVRSPSPAPSSSDSKTPGPVYTLALRPAEQPTTPHVSTLVTASTSAAPMAEDTSPCVNNEAETPATSAASDLNPRAEDPFMPPTVPSSPVSTTTTDPNVAAQEVLRWSCNHCHHAVDTNPAPDNTLLQLGTSRKRQRDESDQWDERVGASRRPRPGYS